MTATSEFTEISSCDGDSEANLENYKETIQEKDRQEQAGPSIRTSVSFFSVEASW